MARCLGGPDDEVTKRMPPIGVRVIRTLWRRDADLNTYRYAALIMTFIAYSCYHASRKPLSIVKSVLDYDEVGNTTSVERSLSEFYQYMPMNHLASRHEAAGGGGFPFQAHHFRYSNSFFNSSANVSDPQPNAGGWAPFNQKGGKGLLGDVDLAFLASYAVGMYFAGHLGDRVDLRLFLTGGMLASGFFVAMFGVGYWLDIHYLSYYIVVQVCAGLVQSSGWPSVVSIVGKWFGKSKRGLIMGIWNAHTSVGNILGSLLAAGALQYGWGWSFLLPGLLQVCGGLIMFCFLVVEPADVGLHIPRDGEEASESETRAILAPPARLESGDLEAGRSANPANPANPASSPTSSRGQPAGAADEETGLLGGAPQSHEAPVERKKDEAVSFAEAWAIPGVAPFAFCLFFSKLVAYTFLNWLPFYIAQTKIAGEYLDDKTSGNLSTLFDVGGVVGGILAGHLSDKMNARATTAAVFMYMAIPALYMYRTFGSVSFYTNIFLMMTAGVLVNGPYALITTAVSADLGTHSSLKGNPNALATVTAIIDGTGSVGAAVGPLITGYVAEYSWDAVFIFLMASAAIAGLLLSRLVWAELSEKIHTDHPVLSKQILQDESNGSITQRLLSSRS
ncbi:MFS transporter, OPA family, solute carrier family 37 (glycerol-3-phosphate transporter), member 1/2 [Marchantia polymorpha subsp. ruderalis]|uniref:Major facilitator superfamily (MFS) profile domain-containing protein n=2 Tax=Marchantia polymorpha TaxID=3197 RepID=A0AAF6B2P5_MARPO|nr:hypothetical protein MARPO_0049s0055 [Marchantia polymorpha]BBN06279.1 hypothetical protein Mp_3g19790 [Marchantia polymorpha subsp. ruderalis]|eukprot:PTQ38764.1 hypothetical protein MARPO_0049s0055 [Marchantia polymorpha]